MDRRVVPAVLSAVAGATGLLALELCRRRSILHLLHSHIKSNPAVGPGTRISVVRGSSDWEKISDVILDDIKRFPFIGLDTEWVNNRGIAGKVSLLQLATWSGHSVLVRLCTLDKVPVSLRNILCDPQILKVGVAVVDDSKKLLVDHNLEVAGCVDLRHLAVRQESAPGKLGLESLALTYLGVQLDKDWRLRAGDWEAEILSVKQINYAANDALVAVNILWILLKQELETHAFSRYRCIFWNEARLVAESRDRLEPFVDLGFSNKDWKMAKRKESGREKSLSPLNPKVRFNAVRKSPLYHNCQLQAPDGQMLCTCDTKKAEWYVKKGIGELISKDPLIVRLKFEPSGRPEGKAGEYYLSVKPNICVVCGSEDSYLRKNVVPHEYRRYFPAVMKDHQSHDVLLMCVHCHQLSNRFDAELRVKLADECGAPIGTENDVKLRDNFALRSVQSAGRALKTARDRIPVHRRQELEAIIKDHYQVDVVDDLVVEKASNCDFHEKNSDYVPHSRAVVQHHLKEGGLLELEVRWRKHFLATMQPKHLPELWSVNHQQERLGVKAAENRIDVEQYMLATQGLCENSDLDLEEYRKTKRPQLGTNPCAVVDSETKHS